MSKFLNRKLKFVGIVAFLLVGMIVAGLILAFVSKRSPEGPLLDLVLPGASDSNNQAISETAPFAELTIPFLRNKSYEGKLGPLNLESDKANYKSYLTDYDSDGLKINAQLTIPKGVKPSGGWPAVVFVHGYIAPTTYTTLGRYVNYVDYLASNGLMVLKIDLRGHGDSEGEPGGAYYSSDYVIDTLNAYNALTGLSDVDSSRVGLWGHSMAGNVLMRSIVVKRDIPVAVIWGGAGYTYTDLREYRLNDNSYRPPSSQSQRRRRRDELFGTHGEFDNNSQFWRSVAPTNYLNEIQTAIQLNHAVDDDVVSVEYSRNLNKLLDQTEIRHEIHEYSSGGHNITGASFSQAMENTLRFLTEY